MFERFTDRARRVVVLAQEEAGRLQHDYIGTEHLLLGLLREGEGAGAKALQAMGISLEAVRGQVEQVAGRGQEPPAGHIPFTPPAKRVMELSLREALLLGHDYIGTEHLLLGLIREGDGVAAQVLVSLGADLNRVRQQVIQALHGAQPHGRRGGGQAGQAGQRLARRLLSPLGEAEILGRLDHIARRLEAIEQHLGISQPPGRPAAPGEPGEPEPGPPGR